MSLKKRAVKITLAAVLIIVILFFIVVLLPRVQLYYNVQKTIEKLTYIDIKADFFTDYSVSGKGELQTVDNGFFSVKIPAEYVLEEKKEEFYPTVYNGVSDKEWVSFFDEPDEFVIDLLDPEFYTEKEGISPDMSAFDIRKGFDRLGYGIPDSTYNSYKCMLQMDSSDHCFWDMNREYSFMITVMTKELLLSSTFSEDDEYFIYERGDVYGIIRSKGEENAYSAVFDFYKADRLNRVHSIIISAQSSEDVFAVINSVEFIGDEVEYSA